MILTIIGALWIISGLLFLWKPHWLKKRLRKKGMRYVRKLMIMSYVFATGSIFGLAYQMGLFIAFIGALVLSVALFVYLFRLYKKMSKHAQETFDGVEDTIIFRVALAYIIAGCILIIGRNYGLFV